MNLWPTFNAPIRKDAGQADILLSHYNAAPIHGWRNAEFLAGYHGNENNWLPWMGWQQDEVQRGMEISDMTDVYGNPHRFPSQRLPGVLTNA